MTSQSEIKKYNLKKTTEEYEFSSPERMQSMMDLIQSQGYTLENGMITRDGELYGKYCQSLQTLTITTYA